MKTIWKYKLKLTDFQIIDMPGAAQILSVQVQEGHLVLWALCTPSAPLAQRRFLIYGTGVQMPDIPTNWHFLASVQMNPFVWHVFEETF